MATIQLTTGAMIGIIVGSIVGGVLIILVIGLICYFCCCRRQRNHRRDKPMKRIEETRTNGHTNLAQPTANLGSLPRNNSEDPDSEKAVGYAYPIVGGRPVSYPYFGAMNAKLPSASSSSSTGNKVTHPVQRQTSVGLPPNAYRLPGLADKSFSMSDTNLSVVGTVNPAYDETGDYDSISHNIYRTQSLMNVNRQETDGSTTSSSKRELAGRLSSFNEDASEVSSTKNRNSLVRIDSEKLKAQAKIRVAHELEAADHIYSLPNKQQKRKAPEQPGPPKGLPRIPLDTPLEVDEPPKSPERATNVRRSLTSEMSFRAKGNLVTDQAFDFLEGYADDGPKS